MAELSPDLHPTDAAEALYREAMSLWTSGDADARMDAANLLYTAESCANVGIAMSLKRLAATSPEDVRTETLYTAGPKA